MKPLHPSHYFSLLKDESAFFKYASPLWVNVFPLFKCESIESLFHLRKGWTGRSQHTFNLTKLCKSIKLKQVFIWMTLNRSGVFVLLCLGRNLATKNIFDYKISTMMKFSQKVEFRWNLVIETIKFYYNDHSTKFQNKNFYFNILCNKLSFQKLEIKISLCLNYLIFFNEIIY